MVKYNYYLKDVSMGFFIDVIKEMKNSKIGKIVTFLGILYIKAAKVKKILNFYEADRGEYISMKPEELPDYVKNKIFTAEIADEGTPQIVEQLNNVETGEIGYYIIHRCYDENIVFNIVYAHNSTMKAESVLYTAFSKNRDGEILVTNGKRPIFNIKSSRKVKYCKSKNLKEVLKEHKKTYRKEQLTEISSEMVLEDLHSYSKQFIEELLEKRLIFKG